MSKFIHKDKIYEIVNMTCKPGYELCS